MLRNKQASAQDAALQSRSSTSGYFVRGTSNTNRTSIMSSLTSKRHSKGCGINTNHINMIQNLYDKATSAVCFNGSTGDWFRTTAGVRQGCLLSPTLFNIFLERIMADALEDHKSTVSIGYRKISSLRFADDIDGLASSKL